MEILLNLDRVTKKQKKLALEYGRLTNRFELSDSDMKRMAEIWEEAQSDDVLNLLIGEIEEQSLQQEELIEEFDDGMPIQYYLITQFDEDAIAAKNISSFKKNDLIIQEIEKLQDSIANQLLPRKNNACQQKQDSSSSQITEKQKKLALEYGRLTNRSELSDSDMKRMAEIWEEAQPDDVLNLLLTEIEESALKENGFIDCVPVIDSEETYNQSVYSNIAEPENEPEPIPKPPLQIPDFAASPIIEGEDEKKTHETQAKSAGTQKSGKGDKDMSDNSRLCDRFDEEFRALVTQSNPDAYSVFTFIQQRLRQFHLQNNNSHEILNEVYLRGRKQIDSGTLILKPLAWIRVTALNVIRERSRERKKMREQTHQRDLIVSSDRLTFEMKDDISLYSTALKLSLSQMNSKDLELLQLRYGKDDLSWQKIGEILGDGLDCSIRNTTLRQKGKGFQSLQRLRKLFYRNLKDLNATVM